MSSEVQIAVIDQQDTQIVLAVPGVQGATGSNIPTGGTANQVLRKASSTNYDTDWSLVTNAMVDSSAAIAGTKISPNFGSQNVVTTGTSTAASFIPTSSSVPTNGVYLPSANNVAISTNGTGALFIDSSGRVIIGAATAAIGNPLEVVSNNVGLSIGVRGRSSDNIGVIAFYPNASATEYCRIQSNGDSSLAFGTGSSGSERMRIRADGTFEIKGGGTAGTSPAVGVNPSAPASSFVIDSSGRVGLGTSSPQPSARLHVYATGDYTDESAPFTVGDSTTGGMRLFFGVNNTSNYGYIGSVESNTAYRSLVLQPNGGVVGIGDTSGATRLVVKGEETLSLFTNLTATTSTFRTTISFADGFGTQRGTITTSTTGTQYNTSSDYRLKENVVPLTGAADRLKQLSVHRFNFIDTPEKTVDGFLAHEAQAVVPEAVHGTKDEVDADGNPVYQGIDQSKLVPLLTAALQEALAEIESLKARLTAAGI